MQPPDVTSVGDDVPLLMEDDNEDVNNLRDTYHELKTQLHSLIAEVPLLQIPSKLPSMSCLQIDCPEHTCT